MRQSRPASPRTRLGLNANPVVPLGTASVRNIDMASAYCTIAAQGQQTETAHCRRSEDARRRHALQGPAEEDAGVQQGRHGRRDLRTPAGRTQRHRHRGTQSRAGRLPAKTGTAALRPDTTTSAWFVGFTPQLCAAVDFYKGTGKADLDGVGGLSTFFGGQYPARVWTAFMTAAMEGKKVEEFPPRADVGKTLNPKPTKTPTPTPTTTTPKPTKTPTPTPTPTVSTPTPTPTGTITVDPLAPGAAPGAPGVTGAAGRAPGGRNGGP